VGLEYAVSVLCNLGLHRAKPMPVWNDGYYFSTCDRCGSSLVRAQFESWHVPRGKRVVWSPTPPPGQRKAELLPASDASEPVTAPTVMVAHNVVESPSHRDELNSGKAVILPIADVLKLLRTEEPPTDPPRKLEVPVHTYQPQAIDPSAAGAPLTNERATPSSLVIGGEEVSAPAAAAAEDTLSLHTEPDRPSSEATEQAATREVEVAEVQEVARSRAPDHVHEPNYDDFMVEPDQPLDDVEFWSTGGTGADRSASESTAGTDAVPETDVRPNAAIFPEVAGDVAKPDGDSLPWSKGVSSPTLGAYAWGKLVQILPYASALFLAGALALLVDGSSNQTDPELTSDSVLTPVAPPPVAAASRPRLASISARLVNCRESPTLGARSLKTLARGDQVQVLASEPGWTSIAYRGRQCWVADRYVSYSPPL
jgi:hypothetical protein